ncbi:hypothetical protein, partial [Streptomyces netropsis]
MSDNSTTTTTAPSADPASDPGGGQAIPLDITVTTTDAGASAMGGTGRVQRGAVRALPATV